VQTVIQGSYAALATPVLVKTLLEVGRKNSVAVLPLPRRVVRLIDLPPRATTYCTPPAEIVSARHVHHRVSAWAGAACAPFRVLLTSSRSNTGRRGRGRDRRGDFLDAGPHEAEPAVSLGVLAVFELQDL
jgi:hypothetical protein